jgi:hypothetical protein
MTGQPSAFVYANGGTCQCGRPITVPEGHVGRRPRFCGYCKQVREGLRFVRAAARKLERIIDPELIAEDRRP